MMLAVNFGIAKYVTGAYSDIDEKAYIKDHALNSHRYIKAVISVLSLVAGKIRRIHSGT